jgi:hypothetical protein
MRTLLSTFAILAIIAGAIAPASAQSSRSDASTGDTKVLVKELREGGYILLVRHGATYSNQADTDPFNLTDITKQRNLNDNGKKLARAFGEAIEPQACPLDRFTPASSIVPTRLPSWPALRTSRQPPISPRVASW